MESARNSQAVKLAFRHYWRRMMQDWKVSIPALLLPGIGNILVYYVPTLIVVGIIKLYDNHAHPPVGQLLPFVAIFSLTWLAGELLWRVGMHLAIMAEVSGKRGLYIDAMHYLHQKNLGFFHDRFAGALTKRVIGYANNYERLFDMIAYLIVAQFIPVIFAAIILWHYSPWLVVTLLGMTFLTILTVVPLIKRRSHMVAVREIASNKVAGHVADSIGNIDAVKSFAGEQ